MVDLYRALAPFYDSLNRDVDYHAWADFAEACFQKYFPGKVASVLDLACGTGSMTLELAARGYDMIGVDASPNMLSVAHARAGAAGLADRILYLCQDMCDFELYGTVEAVVCCLDAVNHITDRAALSRCFHWVHNYLVPDGLFLFDVNSPYKFEHVYGDRAYLLEEEGVLCAWQNDYRPASHTCDFYISLFTEDEDGRYARQDACQRERMYTLRSLRRLLQENGLAFVAAWGDFNFGEPRDDCERYYIAARAVKGDPVL